MFGYNNDGAFFRLEVGDGTTTPVPVSFVSDAISNNSNDAASCQVNRPRQYQVLLRQ